MEESFLRVNSSNNGSAFSWFRKTQTPLAEAVSVPSKMILELGSCSRLGRCLIDLAK
jgi:hypothetical protein